MLTADGPRSSSSTRGSAIPKPRCCYRSANRSCRSCKPRRRASLDARPLRPLADRRVGVVVASGGYPDAFKSGHRIEGLAEAAALPGVSRLSRRDATPRQRIVTSGGRVLTVVGSGTDFPAAIAHAYAGVDAI